MKFVFVYCIQFLICLHSDEYDTMLWEFCTESVCHNDVVHYIFKGLIMSKNWIMLDIKSRY